MKLYSIIIAAVLFCIVTTVPAAQAWTPVDGDAVLKGIAEETNGVRLIRVLPVGAGSGTASDVNVLNFPATQNTDDAATRAVVQAVLDKLLDSISVAVSNFPASQPVSGTVDIGNLPATQPVSGTVSVDNFPAVQATSVQGSVSVDLAGQLVRTIVEDIVAVTIANFPAVQAVSGTFWQAIQPVSGTVSVSNLPAVQPVSGEVNIGNWPAAQEVTGDFYPPTQPVSGTVNIGNLPAVQPVSGTVGVEFPAVQEVSGSVAVSNLPAVQEVSGTVGISGTVPVAVWDDTPVKVAQQGAVDIGNFPAVQPVSGTVGVNNFPSSFNVTASAPLDVKITDLPVEVVVGTVEVMPSVEVANFPAVQAVLMASTAPVTLAGELIRASIEQIVGVEITNFPVVQAVTGTFWPETQPVSGSVSVSNLPATQEVEPKSGSVWTVAGTFWQAIQPVSGTVSIDNWPAAQEVTGDFYPATQPVSGTIDIGNFPAVQTITPAGTVPVEFDRAIPLSVFFQSPPSVSVNNLPAVQPVSIADPVAVTGTFWPTTQPVSGSVDIENFPATQVVSFGGTTQPVSIEGEIQATIDAISFDGAQPVYAAGTLPVAVDPSFPLAVFFQSSQPVSVDNFPASFDIGNFPAVQPVSISDPVAVTGTFWPATQPVSGTVSVDNFPASQNVAGTVSVDNFPATQAVSIADTISVQIDDAVPVKVEPVGVADVSVTNFPAVQEVSGTVGVEFPAIQPVSGTVAIGNLPATQAVTAAGTFPVTIAPETPVRVYSTDTLPVAIVAPAEPVRQRWSETINPTTVNGSAVTVALTNTPSIWTLANLSDTHPVYLRKGGATATASDLRIQPGQALTADDGDKVFSVYGIADAQPASFQIFSVYEIILQ